MPVVDPNGIVIILPAGPDQGKDKRLVKISLNQVAQDNQYAPDAAYEIVLY